MELAQRVGAPPPQTAAAAARGLATPPRRQPPSGSGQMSPSASRLMQAAALQRTRKSLAQALLGPAGPAPAQQPAAAQQAPARSTLQQLLADSTESSPVRMASRQHSLYGGRGAGPSHQGWEGDAEAGWQLAAAQAVDEELWRPQAQSAALSRALSRQRSHVHVVEGFDAGGAGGSLLSALERAPASSCGWEADGSCWEGGDGGGEASDPEGSQRSWGVWVSAGGQAQVGGLGCRGMPGGCGVCRRGGGGADSLHCWRMGSRRKAVCLSCGRYVSCFCCRMQRLHHRHCCP